ncbi:MAG: D-erythronate dehydrogenase [Paracoccaceae bacterium]
MTKTLIIGGGGMIGRKLANTLTEAGEASDLTLFDVAYPTDMSDGFTCLSGDITDPAVTDNLAAQRPDVIYHLAAIVSGEAEADFDKGWQTNMLAFWRFLEAIRAQHLASGGTYRPRIVFTSSIAVFGGPFPDKIGDEFLSAPQTSYGAQKACSELMLTDFSRKGFVDGISIRLPTICVRPGKPNKAASGFFSGIIREPLNGQEAILPVPTSVRHWHASPRAAVGFLRHSAALDLDRLEGRRALSLPGFSCTVEEQIEALRDVAGNDAVNLIRHERDETISSMVEFWPRDFEPQRALDLGYRAEGSFREIIDIYMSEDMPKSG